MNFHNYIFMLMSCILVTKSYAMENDRGSVAIAIDGRNDRRAGTQASNQRNPYNWFGTDLRNVRSVNPLDYEDPEVRKIPLSKRCLEHFAVGFFEGAVLGTVVQDPETLFFPGVLLPIITYPIAQRLRGYNDLDLKSGIMFAQNDMRVNATCFSQMFGYGAGAATAVICGYLRQHALQEGSATEQ